jgi:multidrug efflux pump subunit AcrB
MSLEPQKRDPGPLGLLAAIEWLAKNHVAANILMIALLIGGFATTLTIKQEVYPSFLLDIVDIRMSYPGASPIEVEDGIVLPIEEELIGLDVVERVEAVAEEGRAEFTVELIEGVDSNLAMQDVKNAMDSVGFLPDDVEEPRLGLRTDWGSVMWLVVYGQLTERQIYELAERVRRDLLALPAIRNVEVRTPRDPEIHVEIPQAKLRSLGLTLGEVAQTIRDSARDVPAGGVRTAGGEVLLSTRERRDYASEYGDIVLVTDDTGTNVRVRDIATLRDGFVERPFKNTFNGGRGIFVSVYETGGGKPLEISEAVHGYLETLKEDLPEGSGYHVLRDRAESYRDRLDLLMRNGSIGLLLVLIVLGMFLEPRLAFWVAMGIPTTIAGSLLLLPLLGASINMISLFAFIITLGIVVDDAVIVGENVFYRIQQGDSRLRAAIVGSRQMAVPIIFAVVTNIVAFMPLLYVPGENGRFFAPLPAVVIAVFMVSLLEALFILPAHLGHGKINRVERGPIALLSRGQQRISNTFERFTDFVVVPVMRYAVRHHAITLSVMFGLLAVMFAWYYSGRMHYTFSPSITGLRVDAEVQTPIGSAFDDTVRIASLVEEAGLRAAEQFGELDDVVSGRMNVVGRRGENWADVNFFLVPADERDFTEGEFVEVWRDEVGEIPGLKSLYFEWEVGPGGGAGLTLELSHPDREQLEGAAIRLADQLATFNGVSDIKDGFSAGKMQLDIELTPEGRSLDITPQFIGRQLRHAFYGAEAMRFQRGRHETKVMVRLPQDERRTLADVEDLFVRTPAGGEVPLSQVAKLHAGTAYTEITRVNGQRILNVSCNISPEIVNVNDVRRSLEEGVLPELRAEFRGLTYEFGGRQREESRAMHKLRIGLVVAMLVVFGLLAALFRSYLQALMIMLVIPFAIGAALFGHVLLGYDLSVVSVFGMIALCGLVVNGGLVLNQEINRLMKEEDLPAEEAVVQAGRRRFRPIMLTSLTTFVGLTPMIFEQSIQARFLVPMAIALGFGTLLSAPVVMLMPACLRTTSSKLKTTALGEAPKTEAPPTPAK